MVDGKRETAITMRYDSNDNNRLLPVAGANALKALLDEYPPKALSELRQECGLTQKELADEAGCSQPVISKWECGGQTDGSATNMHNICRVLSIKLGRKVTTLDVLEFAPTIIR